MCNFFTGKNMLSLSRQKLLLSYGAVAFLYFFIFTGNLSFAGPLPENPKEIPWHISALAVTFDNKRDLYIAEDEVVITGGKTRLEADYVEFSNKTKDVFAQGNVILISGEDSISCNAMSINLTTEIGTINKGTIYIQENNFYIHGENIRKTGKFTYSADKGTITSCSGDSPDWKISGRNVNVTVEGYGTASHAVLWAKKVPAAYTPFLVFPAKGKRQTGLLIPSVSSSDRKGFEYQQPLFIAISKSTDATIYADYMSDRGTKIGTEYRYVLDNKSKGSVFLDYLKDAKTDDGTLKTENYSYVTTPQRTNEDRYWFRAKIDQELPNGFTAKVDLDVASDADYLQEFQDGFSGYDETMAYFEKAFGRSLDEYDDTLRKNRLNISKSWSTYTFNADALWYDNINARRQDTADTTLQTLPSLQFDAFKQQIGASGFFYSLDSEVQSFYRQDTTEVLVNGQRTDIYPKIYLPVKLGKNFNLEPSIGLRETIWHTTDFTDINGNSDSIRTRQIPDFGTEISTKLSKIYNPENDFADKIKHEIIPKLEYAFTPDVFQDDLPLFDSLDRVAGQNLITWSFANTFTSRQAGHTPKGEETLTYRDFAYIKLSQSYDIKKKREDNPEPFSDIALDCEFYPNDFLSLDTDLTWSPYDKEFTTLNIGSTLKDKRGDELRIEYRYNETVSESVYSKIDINLTDELTAYYSIEKNLKEGETVETQTGLSLTKKCWTLSLFFTETTGDTAIAFLINLHGLGEFGTK